MQKHRERPTVPAVDELVGDQPLPGRPTRPEPRLDRRREERLEPCPLTRHAGCQISDWRTDRLEFSQRLPCDVVGEIDRPCAAHAPGGTAHEFLVDRGDKFTKSRLGLEAGGRAAGGLHGVEPEDPRYVEPLRLELVLPVGADVGIARGVRLHEEQRPARGERGELAGHDPRTVFLRGRHDEQHVARRHHGLEQVAVVVGVARPGRPIGGSGLVGLRVGIGTVDEHDVGHRGGIAPHHAGLHPIEREPRAIDVGRHHDDRRGGGGPGHVAGGGDGAAGERVHERALAGAGAADHAHHEHAREFAPGAVEPGLDLLPRPAHALRRRPLGQRAAPGPERGDERVEGRVVEAPAAIGGRRRVGRGVGRGCHGLENSRCNSSRSRRASATSGRAAAAASRSISSTLSPSTTS